MAALHVKARVSRHYPGFSPYYRLSFNILSVLLLLPLLWATYTTPGDWLWRWTGLWAWLANGLALAALAGFVYSAGTYDLGEFLGLHPLREKRRDASEHDRFRIAPLHRFVRHPWYALALVLIWTRDMNAPLLVSASVITLYFITGSWLEERKLEAYFGDAYRIYKKKVPGLIPLPWKQLSSAEADALMQRSMECSRHRQDEF